MSEQPPGQPDPRFMNDYPRLAFELEAAAAGQSDAASIAAYKLLLRLWNPDSTEGEEVNKQAVLHNFRWIREAMTAARRER